MIKMIISVVALLLITGCTSTEDANRALQSSGFTDIQITGYDVFACSKGDFFHTGFSAINSQGILVEGTTVCSGLFFKSATVSF